MRTLFTCLIGLCLPLLAHAEYSREYLDSHPLQMEPVGELEVAYRIIAPGEGKPKIVAIMGLGGSNVAWGDQLISGLADSGYEILLLDNRDTGASTRFDDWGQPVLWWELLKYRFGFSVNAPYTLNDMGADIAGLMDAVGYKEAHIMGVSMGGMGALRIAFTKPDLFGAVAVHSSAVFAKDPDDMPARLKGFAGRLGFGDPIDKKVWKEVNPTCIADKLDASSLKGLRIYFDAGTDDRYGFDSGNKLLHSCLEGRGIPHLWRLVRGGGHSWGDRFQDETLPSSFRFVGAMFRGEPARGSADGKGKSAPDAPEREPGGRRSGGR